MAARAALGIGLVVGDVLVTGHAGCAIGVYLGFVNVVAGLAFGVAFALGLRWNAMKPRQLGDLVTAAALGLRRHGAAMRFVTSRALPMSFRTLGELLIVTGPAGDDPCGFVGCPLMTCFAARMS